MKTNLNIAILAAALMLPAMVAVAADQENKAAKEQPRPAQESRSGNTTGKESTKPTDKPAEVAPKPASDPAPARPAAAREDSKTQPRPAQESRSGATTGRDATKSPEVPKAPEEPAKK